MNINRLTFEQEIKKAIGYKAPQLVFDITTNEYTAYFRPKYPERTAADIMIVYNPAIAAFKLYGNLEALIPTTKHYYTFEKLLSDLREMDDSNPINTRYVVVDFYAGDNKISNDGVYDTFDEAQKAMLADFADYVDCYIDNASALKDAIGDATIEELNKICMDKRCFITEETAKYSDDYTHENDCYWQILEI